MNVQRLRSWLWITAAACIVAALGIVVLAWRTPYLDAADQASRRVITTAATTDDQSKLPGVEQFAPLMDTASRLRRPLFDPPPPAPPKAKPPPPLRVRLAGTIIDPEDAQAMLIGSSGAIQFLRVGDVIDDATILEITESSVRVEYHNEEHQLTNPTPGS